MVGATAAAKPSGIPAPKGRTPFTTKPSDLSPAGTFGWINDPNTVASSFATFHAGEGKVVVGKIPDGAWVADCLVQPATGTSAPFTVKTQSTMNGVVFGTATAALVPKDGHLVFGMFMNAGTPTVGYGNTVAIERAEAWTWYECKFTPVD